MQTRNPLTGFVRSAVTAIAAPFWHYYRVGHTRSSFANRAMDRRGKPLPWYSYPCIEFLQRRDFSERRVLEFGAGQSTYWWASVAREVVAIEADRHWFDQVKTASPDNATVHLVRGDDAEAVRGIPIEGLFDVIVIDGLKREEMIEVAITWLAPDGVIIADDSDGYGFFERFQGKGFRRVDFYGAAPGIIKPRVTSLFFRDGCFLFDDTHPI
jgi:Methyltransferase domain